MWLISQIRTGIDTPKFQCWNYDALDDSLDDALDDSLDDWCFWTVWILLPVQASMAQAKSKVIHWAALLSESYGTLEFADFAASKESKASKASSMLEKDEDFWRFCCFPCRWAKGPHHVTIWDLDLKPFEQLLHVRFWALMWLLQQRTGLKHIKVDEPARLLPFICMICLCYFILNDCSAICMVWDIVNHLVIMALECFSSFVPWSLWILLFS